MVLQDLAHERNSRGRGDVGEANQARMGSTMQVNERAEVRVDRNQDALLCSGPAEQGRIAWIGSPLPRFGNVMTLGSEPLRQPAPGASIDQKSHAGAIRTASSRSSAITA